MTRLLINENPLQVLPTLAVKIGLTEALILQQMHYWLNADHNKNYLRGRHWVYNSYDEWHKQFPFWSKETIKRTIYSLERQKLVVSNKLSEEKFNHRKWYSIDYLELQRLDHENDRSCQFVTNGEVTYETPDQVKMTRSDKSDCYEHIKEQKLQAENILSPSPTSSSFRPLEEEKEKIANKMKEIWVEVIGFIEINQLNPSLILNLYQCFQNLFSSSLDNWKSYCRKIASSKFLMGEGGGKNFQKPWLTWAIKEDTYQKIESGQFTLGDRITFLTEAKNEENKAEKEELLHKEILSSSKHPLWHQLCLSLIDKLGSKIVKQWLLEMDIASLNQNEVCLKVSHMFARDWVNKNLKSQLISALEEVLGHPVDHLKIEVPQNFGILPLPELVEGETPNSSPSTYQNNPSFDAPQASNAEEHSVPQSSPLTYPSSLDTAGSLSRELHLKYNELKLNGVNA